MQLKELPMRPIAILFAASISTVTLGCGNDSSSSSEITLEEVQQAVAEHQPVYVRCRGRDVYEEAEQATKGSEAAVSSITYDSGGGPASFSLTISTPQGPERVQQVSVPRSAFKRLLADRMCSISIESSRR